MNKDNFWTDELVKDVSEYIALRVNTKTDFREQMKYLIEDFKSSHEQKPEQERGWEIVAYSDVNCIYTKCYDGLFRTNPIHDVGARHESEVNHQKIHSVKRLSDNSFWLVDEYTADGKIKSFEIVGEMIKANLYPDDGYDKYIWLPAFEKLPDQKSKPEKERPVLFTTEDGVEIYDMKYNNGVIPFVDIKNWKIGGSTISSFSKSNDRFKLFSTIEAAENYRTINKPCLSVNDIKTICHHLANRAEVTINVDAINDGVKSFAKSKQSV